jgi:hypothetical protein
VDTTTAAAATAGSSGDTWSWAPYAPEDFVRFRLDEWAPPTSVRRPWVRVGRFTLLYRRAC